MKLLTWLLVWIPRLPALFTLLFVAGMLGYLALVAVIVKAGGVQTMADALWVLVGLPRPPAVLGFDVATRVFWEGLVVVLALFVGVLASYNLAAAVHRAARPRVRIRVAGPQPERPGTGTALRDVQRIGIILAGGGAKGAYQAGALRAVHEFLEANGALDRVRMIAGTSIGSWNAMFWLAGLVKPPPAGGPSPHEAWWRSIRLSRILEFDQYLPMRSNHFLRPTPWRESFRELFSRPEAVRARLGRLFQTPAIGGAEPTHFYFTRSNVERGHLEFSTNRASLRTLTRPRLRTPDPTDEEPVVPADRYEVIEGPVEEAVPRMERAVFASMDLPPLFPYLPIKVEHTEYFEDGGVVENLPVSFGAQIERCDLLFVLPLNASFAEPVNHTSVLGRLSRVMDVRQGVIERHAMKLSYLYNELAALRNRVDELESPRERKSRDTLELQQRAVALEATALRRSHRPISIFAICPAPPLAIATTEFWKGREAGQAFELMYAATRYELAENFTQNTDPNWVRMTLVGPQGERTWTDDF